MPSIQYIVDRLPKHETERYGTRTRSSISALVIHHSATPPNVTPERIAQYHITKWEWAGIGYHFLVAADGAIYQTNDLETVSHHAASVNPMGVGICFLGNFTEEVPPADQIRAGAHLVAWLLELLHLDLSSVKGHKEFMQTACPGKTWLEEQTWKESLLQGITQAQEDAQAVQKAQEAQKAKEAQEAEEARKAEEAQKALEEQKAREAEEERKAREEQKAREAEEERKALEEQKAREAKEAKEALEAQEAEDDQGVQTTQPASSAPGAKPIYQYMLFPSGNGKLAKQNWKSAQEYIATFQPTIGFRATDALHAEFVTIVGGSPGTATMVEEWLEANGCKVEHIAGKNAAETKRMLAKLVNKGTRFLSFEG
jgi:outer membrane biosynthesis protein TonB